MFRVLGIYNFAHPPASAIPVMLTVHYHSIRYAIQYRTACCLTMSMLDARIMGLLIEMK